MFILKPILDTIQLEFQKSQQRGKLFIAILLAILLSAVGSRSSQLFLIIKSVFGFKISRRSLYHHDGISRVAMDTFMAVFMEANSITVNRRTFAASSR